MQKMRWWRFAFGTFGIAIVWGGGGAIVAACTAFGNSGTDPTIDTPANDAQPDANANPGADGPTDGAGEPADGSTHPCGADASVVFFDSFPTQTLAPEWRISFPAGANATGEFAFVPAVAPASSPYALRLTRTSLYGIATTRKVELSGSKELEIHFKALITGTDHRVFAQVTTPETDGGPPTVVIFRLLFDGAVVIVEDGSHNPIAQPTLKLSTGWASWKIRLGNGKLSVSQTGQLVNSAEGQIPGASATALDFMLLGFVDGTVLGPRPYVDFDDVAACLPFE